MGQELLDARIDALANKRGMRFAESHDWAIEPT
jgi:hypothetical protein